MNNWRDLQSILYLACLPIIVAWAWMQPSFNAVAYMAIILLMIGVCCISHNHAHQPIWRIFWLNRLTDLWIGTLQGQPVFLFKPAHIESHHRYNQTKEDITRIARYSPGNNLIGYLIFPFQILPELRKLKKHYLASMWRANRKEFWWIVVLHFPLALLWIGLFSLSPVKAVIYVVIPQLVGLHFLLASNYLQHAHAIVGSRYNHSRNFVGFINWIWFNVGYHTAHHENAKLHWTLLPSAHREISKHISPLLIETSLISYTIRTLLMGSMFPRLRSIQVEE